MGIPQVMPPLATWAQMLDGTLTLEDVAQMHLVMDEAEKAAKQAMEG
jgi:hypothetical protein